MRTYWIAVLATGLAAAGAAGAADLWQLAKEKRPIHQFSTLFTAQDVRDRLADDAGLAAAIDWCHKTGVTKVYLETFRDGYQAERATLQKAIERFRAAEFEVSGCVTTTNVGKPSTGWKLLSCYTDFATQNRVQSIFEYTAGLFDEIMIDDFWFTDCTCPQCDAARRLQTVNLSGRTFHVEGQTWEDYRRGLMWRLSQERILAPARKVNPNVKVILKYPEWYDRLQERGYDVVRETADFDKIWVGTETRDRDQGGSVPYQAYFIMRWLGALGGKKVGGGWYDPLKTTPPTYLEQARQTVLAGARESMLFSYGVLGRASGPADVEALRASIPELLATAEQMRLRPAVGIAAYKPANSYGPGEPNIFGYAGMLGLPLLPTDRFPEEAPAAFFSTHALKDPELTLKLTMYILSGRPTLLTESLAEQLDPQVLKARNVRILRVNGDPKSLLGLSGQDLESIRALMLKPLNTTFHGPNEVGLYLFADGSSVVENFGAEEAAVELNGAAFKVPARGWVARWK
jgi:hypothetical protein